MSIKNKQMFQKLLDYRPNKEILKNKNNLHYASIDHL